MSGDHSRLPKWVQTEIARLTNDRDTWKEKYLRGPEDANVFITSWPEDKPLGKNLNIRFRTEQPGFDQYFDVRVDRGELLIHGGRSLLIAPQVTNVIRLRIGD